MVSASGTTISLRPPMTRCANSCASPPSAAPRRPSLAASHPNRVYSRRELMDQVWGYTSALDTGTVTVHVRRLREKIEDDPSRPRLLETVWGSGYRFTA